MRVTPTSRSLELKEAMIASFALGGSEAHLRLEGFDEADWLSVMWWLDISGMAIYFLDRTRYIGVDRIIPRSIEGGLAERLINNRIRMKSLMKESRALAAWLEGGGVPYALLKGFTLSPESVPESALRCQTDVDFLVASRHAELVIHYINRLGYKLHAKSGYTLEFRAGAPNVPDLANLYSVQTQRALELHLLPDSGGDCKLLTRRVKRDLDGFEIYSLSPPDIMVQQALHVLKHLCSEHTRLSWVLEFWRHIKARGRDREFWRVAESRAAEAINGNLAMAATLWVAENLFGRTAVDLPSQWNTDALPVRVRLWLERYARRLLLSDSIGSKLYALLRKEVPCAPHEARRTRDILLPRVLPAPILEARPHESCADRWVRYAIEADFVLWRLWFHVREGVRYAVELSLWSRATAKVD